MTRHDYDIFEKFPEGSTLWKARIRGRFEAQRKIDELTERSGNQFNIIETEGYLAHPVIDPIKSKPLTQRAATSSFAGGFLMSMQNRIVPHAHMFTVEVSNVRFSDPA